MTSKIDLPPVPPALADVALIDGPTCAAAGGISLSTWHDLVRLKAAPQPAIRQSRCTRWRMSDIRTWLIERAANPAPAAFDVTARAAKASAKAQAARQARDAARAVQAGA